MVWYLYYILIGLFIGFVAGLFGIGGGTTQVPLLFLIFSAQGFPKDLVMHISLGTSMASIFFTSLSSMRAHHIHGAVRWDIFKAMTPGLLTGTLAGALSVGWIPAKTLSIFFIIIMYYAAIQIILDFKPKAHSQLPGKKGLFIAGLIIGLISSFAAAGGGFLSVPFMLYCNVSIYQAVGTSSALGFPIALSGLIGYIFSGYGVNGLPAYSIGYVYLPACLAVVSMSVITAPLGARLAHRLPVKRLKRYFGIFLLLVATRLLLNVIF